MNQDTELSDAVREQELQILDEAFNPPEEEKAEAKEVPEDEGDKAPARDEQGRFAAKSEPKDEKAEPSSRAASRRRGPADGKDEDGEQRPAVAAA